jgi:hypothetical protein
LQTAKDGAEKLQQLSGGNLSASPAQNFVDKSSPAADALQKYKAALAAVQQQGTPTKENTDALATAFNNLKSTVDGSPGHVKPFVARGYPTRRWNAGIGSIDRESPLGAHLVRGPFQYLALIRHFTPPILSLDRQHHGTQTTKAQEFFDGLPTNRDG